MHSVFLFHAIKNGLTMGIVNSGQLTVYEEIEPELKEIIEDVILNRNNNSTEMLVEVATKFQNKGKENKDEKLDWRLDPVEKRISHALVHGINKFIIEIMFLFFR